MNDTAFKQRVGCEYPVGRESCPNEIHSYVDGLPVCEQHVIELANKLGPKREH